MSLNDSEYGSSNPDRLPGLLDKLTHCAWNYLLSTLDAAELTRLSTCCCLLRNEIQNNHILWKNKYKDRFLSGVYDKHEWDFVLWCARTDKNNAVNSMKRTEVLANLDWYNIYRRRVITEYNWRFGYANTTRIDLHPRRGGLFAEMNDDTATGAVLSGHCYGDGSIVYLTYNLEYPGHSDLRRNNRNTRECTLSNMDNVVVWDKDDNGGQRVYSQFPVMSDYYIMLVYNLNASNDVAEIHTRGYPNILGKVHVAPYTLVDAIEGKWALLYSVVDKSTNEISLEPVGSSPYDAYRTNITVMNMELTTACPGRIDAIWDVACFYETKEHSVIVYTARINRQDSDYMEWALYRFSDNNPVRQIRNGSIRLTGIDTPALCRPYPFEKTRIIIEVGEINYNYVYVVHSVALSGESRMPQHATYISTERMPDSLLKLGLIYDYPRSITIYSDKSYDSERMSRIRDTERYDHIIGDLYAVTVEEPDEFAVHLVDVGTMKKLRRLNDTDECTTKAYYSMTGLITYDKGGCRMTMHEYGAL